MKIVIEISLRACPLPDMTFQALVRPVPTSVDEESSLMQLAPLVDESLTGVRAYARGWSCGQIELTLWYLGNGERVRPYATRADFDVKRGRFVDEDFEHPLPSPVRHIIN